MSPRVRLAGPTRGSDTRATTLPRMPEPDRRRVLIDVGRRQFIDVGYAAGSIDDICRKAGVTKGGFFHYFPSKEAFAREVLAATWDVFLEAHRDVDASPAAQAVRDHITFMVGFIAGDGRVIPRLAQELGATNDEVRNQVRGYFEVWTAMLESTLERAGCRDARSLMEFIIAGIEGAPMVAGQLGEQVLEHTIEHLIAHVQEALARTDA